MSISRRRPVPVAALGVAILVINAGLAAAQSLEGIGILGRGTYSSASGVNADGTVVIGFCANAFNREAFRWVDGTMSGLGFLDGMTYSSANGVNADGTVVVGLSDDEGLTPEAFRWVDGTMSGLGFLGTGTSSSANGVNADGTVVVGVSDNGSKNEAFRWVDGTMSGLGFLDGDFYSSAFGVNADGTVVVGISSNGSTNEAFRWVDGTMSGLGFLGTGNFSSAFGVNADGTVVVGSSYNGSNDEAFRWVDGTMSGLGILDGSTYSSANGVNADGTVVVGYSTDGLTSEAFRWVADDPAGMVSVAHLLEEAGVDLGEWDLQNATGVSASGNIVVGSGTNPDGIDEAWIARLGPEAGLITPDAAMNSLLTLGQVPNAASNFIFNFLDSSSEYARQHAASVGTPAVQPLGYAEEEGDGVGYALTPTRPLRVFGYGLGGAAFDSDGWSGAALIGASVAVTDHVVVGGSLGYGAVSSDMDLGGEATIRGPAGTVFIASTPETGFQMLATGTIAGFDADIRRGYMNGGGLASSSGDTDGTGYGGLVRLGYALALDDRNRVEPFAAYQAVHIDLDAYTETGGPFPAEISEMSQTDQVGRLGAEFRHRFQPDAWVWGSAAWAHRFDNSGVDLAVQLIDLFGVSGTAPVGASDWLEVTTGVSFPVSLTTRVTGSVTAGLFGESSDTLLGRAGVSMAF